MTTTTQTEATREVRFQPLVGVCRGLSMNMALGTLYGWSVFVAPSKRNSTGHALRLQPRSRSRSRSFALSFILPGGFRTNSGRSGFRSLARSRQHGILSVFLHALAHMAVRFALASSEGWERLRLCHADSGHGQVVSRQARPRGRPGRRRDTARGRPSSGRFPARSLIPTYGWRETFMILGAIFFVMTMIGAFC